MISSGWLRHLMVWIVMAAACISARAQSGNLIPGFPPPSDPPGLYPCECPTSVVHSRRAVAALFGCPEHYVRPGDSVNLIYLAFYEDNPNCTLEIADDPFQPMFVDPEARPLEIAPGEGGCAEIKLICRVPDGHGGWDCVVCETCRVCRAGADACRVSVVFTEVPGDDVVTPERLADVVAKVRAGPEGGELAWALRVFPAPVGGGPVCTTIDPRCDCEVASEDCQTLCVAPFRAVGAGGELRLGDHPDFPVGLGDGPSPGDVVMLRARYTWTETVNGVPRACQACVTHLFRLASDRDGDGLA
ncbi:MAG: hypothetical protein ACK4WH_03965, partial [Phycisphaerales bacterium]